MVDDRIVFVTPHSHLVPEKSDKISQPPRTVQILTDEGIIKRIPVSTNALVNRSTAEWYLDRMRAETEWNLGFLAIVEHEKPYFPNSALPFNVVDGSLAHHVDTSRRNPQPHRNNPFRTGKSSALHRL